MNTLKRITEKIKLWEGLDEMVTSDTVVVNLKDVKREVIADNKALLEKLKDAETTVYPAFGNAYKVYGAARVEMLIREIWEKTEFYAEE